MTEPGVPSRPPSPAGGEVVRPAFGEEGAGASALDRVLREPDLRARLSREARDLLRLERRLAEGVAGDLSRRFCLRVVEEAERLEGNLVEVGARGNRLYAPFTEVVTAVRWAAKALHALLHLRGRVTRYLGERPELAEFRRELDEAVRWLAGRVDALLRAAREEAEGPLALAVPADAMEPAGLRGEDVRWRLPQDLHVAQAADLREHAAEQALAFLALADEVERLSPPSATDPSALETFARDGFPVAAAQEARVRMHAIQSAYDALVGGTPAETADPRLRSFRGYVSILLHLLEAVAYLLQIHARLAHDLRSEPLCARLQPIVRPADVLRWAVGFGVPGVLACFREGRAAAQAVLDGSLRVREIALDLPPGRKLHLRPAGLIVRVVQRHGLPVEMSMGEQTVDARQLMDVILLAASHPGSTQVRFRGDDRPLADLEALFAHRLGEDGLETLPPSLAFLREPSRRT